MSFKLKRLFTIILTIKYLCCVANNVENPLLINITNGQLRGKDNNFYYSYESIPYAEPPIGQLRFEPPQPYQQKWDKEFDASVKPKPCMQWDQMMEGENKLNGIEDCLTVNIYKPKTEKSKYPVMVFLHGGGFMHGDINRNREDYLMENGNMMLVKITYRLGPLGFLSAEDEVISGNFGLKDQQLALKWIKANIAAFGGDPERIMLTGFSAGGASTHLHLLQPTTAGLIKTAVSFSGVALNPWVIIKNARKNAFKVADILKCPKTENTQEIKRCLQSHSAEDIVSSVKYLLNFGYNPFTTFGPVVEHTKTPGAFITQDPEDIIKSGNFSHIPFLASFTAQDGGYNAAELLQINPRTGEEYIYDLNEHWLELAPQNLFLNNIDANPQEYAEALKINYLGEENFTVENYWNVLEMYTDVLFRNGILETLKLHSRHSHSKVYGYIYDNPANQSVGYTLSHRSDIKFGTNHIDDLSLILKCVVRTSQRPDEVIISHKFINMLVNFVETGDLSFGDCDFENNDADSNQLKLLRITKDRCETISETN